MGFWSDKEGLEAPRKVVTMKETLKRLIETCRFLAKYELEVSSVGHWSEDKEEICKALGRRLSDDELTCHSLARGYGPCPALPEVAQEVMDVLFPGGNDHGNFYSYACLARHLEHVDLSFVINFVPDYGFPGFVRDAMKVLERVDKTRLKDLRKEASFWIKVRDVAGEAVPEVNIRAGAAVAAILKYEEECGCSEYQHFSVNSDSVVFGDWVSVNASGSCYIRGLAAIYYFWNAVVEGEKELPPGASYRMFSTHDGCCTVEGCREVLKNLAALTE